MYEIDYGSRTIYEEIDGMLYEIVIRKSDNKPLYFRNYDTNLKYTEIWIYTSREETLDGIIDAIKADIEKAKTLAKGKFKGHVDKAGVDYFTGHLQTVATNTLTYQGEIVGYLHDVLEDTDMTYEKLEDAFGKQTADAVMALTKPDDIAYMDYIKTITNTIGKEVKICDLRNNSDLTRLNEITDKDRERVKKYESALEYLGNDLDKIYQEI